MRPRLPLLLVLLAVTPLACGDDGGAPPDAAAPDAPLAATADWTRDVLDTRLAIDLLSREATATITLAASASHGASFEIGDLELASVTDGDGAALPFVDNGDTVDVGVATTDEATLVFAYTFRYHDGFQGADDNPALTLTWPYYCGNLFPCKTHDNPADGTAFALELTGVPETKVAIYPHEIAAASPPYMLAWAIAAYTELDLGTTTAGTHVKMWYQPNQLNAATAGGAHLRDSFDWFEQTLGPYLFGDTVGSVSATWGFGAYGGMEHHPFWHVGSTALGDEEVNVHEAAHGWFGNGVRLRCWEDFTLSEGTVTYLAARALTVTGGPVLAQSIWDAYAARLQGLRDDGGGGVAWPDSCGAVDILDLFSDTPYTKGAYFYRAVANHVGVDALDAALSAFYMRYRGEAAGMQDMLDTIEAETGWDPTACATKWLRTAEVPADLECP
ncbi:MAG: peptidase M1 [Kofleriaceae bacterium]|nr:peptidase M1 [Myxococcales bacterium]MCB9562354.1 peptidase M1 [Kofleriaceae bacterium]MCB9574771.1 peptidase M1 [Kofleriaceae bacterium]